MNAYARYFAATTRFRDFLESDVVTPPTASCACCSRPWDTVERPNEAVVYQYDPKHAREYYCLTCYTPKIGEPELLGIERRAGGKTRTTAQGESIVVKEATKIPGKLGMMLSSGGVITADNTLYLALSNGYMGRFKEGTWARSGYARQRNAFGLLLDLYRTGELGDISKGIIYISDFGRKSQVLMGSLKQTTSLRELWVNHWEGAGMMDLAALLDTAQWLKDKGYDRKACTSAFWKPIMNAARGRRDAKALQKWADNIPGAEQLIQRLPSDPHDRQGLHTTMTKIYEAMG